MARTRWFLTFLFVLAVLALFLFYFVRPASGQGLTPPILGG